MGANDSTAMPLPEVVIDEREILANLIYPASEDGGDDNRDDA
jgi:hypothetical protein